MAAKARTYLAGGTRLVWVVWPSRSQVDVWRAGEVAPTTLGVDAILDGERVVPGFTFRLADVFA